MANGNGPVANPTWYGDIRGMFTDTDIAHMKGVAQLDLSTYDDVRSAAADIYGQVAAGRMPPGAPWSAGQVATFLNWVKNGYPKGSPPPQPATMLKMADGTSAPRIRKEISALSSEEIQKVIAAFNGILAKDISDPNSYFAQAGFHWLPKGNLYCVHHSSGYNPWHRAFLMSFEDALRSVPGCEDVTLPYWDITQPFPEVLKNPPFDSYTFPIDVGDGYPAGYQTSRFAYPQIQENLATYKVADKIAFALTQTDWEDFHGLFAGAPNVAIINAHDMGHNSIGPTMQDQNIAAFDPVFWFFHCNWDRLFWNWQVGMQATNQTGLMGTINKQTDPQSYNIFNDPTLQKLMVKPFDSILNLSTIAIIDSANSLGVDYQNPAGAKAAFAPKLKMASASSEAFSINTGIVNVRVSGLNRLKVPGSFLVHLMKDGKVLETSGFFQPNEAEKCPNCVNNAVVHFDFMLPLKAISKSKLEVVVEPVNKDVVGERFPHKLLGDPKIDVSFLISNE